MTQAGAYTITELTEEYLAERQINKKKYFAGYLIYAKLAWRHLFTKTIYSVQSEWKTLKKGTPYNYIDVPSGMSRLFSVAEQDDCGNIVPIFYNPKLGIISKPSVKQCGCNDCECGGLCEDMNSLTLTTRIIFTLSGVDYIEKTWIKSCPNGDVIQFKVTPVKKYNNFTGDGADYLVDYNNDYDIPAPFSDYTIVYDTSQKIICKIDVLPCGCPVDSPQNAQTLQTACGLFLCAYNKCGSGIYQDLLGNINDNHRGEIKISECGTKIYYKPSPHWHTTGPKSKLPDFLLVNFQTSGDNCNGQVVVPTYSVDAMKYGIDFFYKRFNNSFSRIDKDHSKYAWVDAQNEVIKFLNPISLEWLSSVQDGAILF